MSTNMKELLEAGVHFGHQTQRWNPKMDNYIYGDKSGIHILDLRITYEAIAQAEEFVQKIVANSGKVLFVGTKPQAQWDCKKPVISVVDGICAGAGSNMILLSDFIIATPEARFIEVFARRGLVVDFGGSWSLPRIVGLQKAKELVMTADEINGSTMNDLNMLYKLVESNELENETDKLIQKLDSLSFISICKNKEQIKNGLNKTFTESLELESVNQNSRFVHSDAAEGMLAFMEKRLPNYKNTLDE